jgi:hypothetical protein
MQVNIAQLKRLVGNPDAYAKQNPDGTWTPVREPLTQSVLEGHLRQAYTVGTYVGHKMEDEELGGDGQWTGAHTLVLDFDSGEEARDQAQQAKNALVKLGLTPAHVGIEFSGRKGYHVWVVLTEDRPNAELRRVGRAALAVAGLPLSTEVFPKQDEVRDLGNLVKLPGGKHQVTGKLCAFEGAVPMPVPPVVWQRLFDALPEEQTARHSGPVQNRFPCLSIIQEGVEENRNIQLFHLAAMFRRHGAEDDLVRTILQHVNEQGDPLDDSELEGIVRNSAHSGPICQQLPGDVESACGEYCIKQRTSGLYTRPGQVRHASEGECVVVRVKSREQGVVQFEHDDIDVAKGRMTDGR